MKDKLELHWQIEAENERKLKDWKEAQKREGVSHSALGELRMPVG